MNRGKLYLEQLNKLKNKIHHSIDEQVVPKEVEASDQKKRRSENIRKTLTDFNFYSLPVEKQKEEWENVWKNQFDDEGNLLQEPKQPVVDNFKKPDKSKPKAASYEIGPVDPLDLAAAERRQAGIEHARSTQAAVDVQLARPVLPGAKALSQTSKSYYETEKRLKDEMEKAEKEGRFSSKDQQSQEWLKNIRVDPDYVGHMQDAAVNMIIAGAFMAQGNRGLNIPGSKKLDKLTTDINRRIGEKISSTRQVQEPPATRLSKAIETDVKSTTLAPGMYDPEVGGYTTQVGVNPNQPIDPSKPNLPVRKGGRDVGYPNVPQTHVGRPDQEVYTPRPLEKGEVGVPVKQVQSKVITPGSFQDIFGTGNLLKSAENMRKKIIDQKLLK